MAIKQSLEVIIVQRIYDSQYLFTVSYNENYGYWVRVESSQDYSPKPLNKSDSERAVKLLDRGYPPALVVKELELSV